MLAPIRWVVWVVLRVVLSLRYAVTIRGADAVRARPGPYLILPNHPAFSDPPNLLVRLWPMFRMRPLFLETNFQNPLFAPIAWLLRGIRMPDISRASAESKRRAEEAVGDVIAALRNGDNVIIWPSGRLSRDGSERLGGARTAADVLAAVPDCTVVLARTRGLWGSMFSWADGPPALMPAFVRAFGLWVANLFVLAPRRRVAVTLEAFAPDQRPAASREAVNAWLEAWFNADAPREEPTFVPRHFLFGPRAHTFPPPLAGAHELDLSKVKAETKAAVTQIVEDKIKRPLAAGENAADATFLQLGMDSLDAMDVALAVEQRFGFSSDDVPTTLGGLWAVAEGLARNAPPKPPPPGWFDPPADTSLMTILGDTVVAAFLNRAMGRKKQVIAADDLAGGVTYERMVVGATAMAARFRAVAAPNVGLMLPASVACDLAFLALHVAGKLPVLLNWTTGPGNLAHAAKLMNLTHVVTSKAFVDRTLVQVPGTAYLFLEDVRGTMGRFELLRRLLAVRWFGASVTAGILARVSGDPHRPAVVLFTSGSEKAPKAVPLTHANIISDQRGCLDALKLDGNHSVLGFLPMFHSFGLTITGLLPLFVGVRVVHHPDPTDAAALARKVATYKPTLVAGTPTFMSYIFERAKPGELASLTLIVLGAEKPGPTLFERAKQAAPGADVIEGYGITECSPVVSVTLPGRPRRGTIGRPISGVEVRVTDLDTNAVLPPGRMGMLHVTGPNVFPGYIGYDGPSPFEEVGGKRWYVTGDLGALDESGEVVFSGRLKRFLKAGGEMISLPALEEPFAKKYPPTDQGPRVAVEGVETPDGRRIVLFTTEPLGLRDANAILQAEGHRGVMRIDDVKQIEKIPTLGTGKTDYKVLRAMIADGA